MINDTLAQKYSDVCSLSTFCSCSIIYKPATPNSIDIKFAIVIAILFHSKIEFERIRANITNDVMAINEFR